MHRFRLRLASIALLSGLAVSVLGAEADNADSLTRGFEQPPNSAAPRVWWHWMNGNITKEGIKLDLEWMKRIGIGGFQTFDASLGTPQVVDQRLAFMTPEWKDAFSYAVTLADQLGLEMAIAGSPGWSESGGPWVMPADAMKKIVWSETLIPGGKPFSGVLAKPPSISGPFQNKARSEFLSFNRGDDKPPAVYYADSAVIAYRVADGATSFRDLTPILTASGGKPDLELLTDGDVTKSFNLPIGVGDAPAWIQYAFAKPQTMYGVTLGVEHVGLPLLLGGVATLAELQSSDDGRDFKKIANVPTESGGLSQDPGQNTVAFAPVTARFFRVVLDRQEPAAGAPAIDLSIMGLPPAPPATEYRVTEFALHSAPVVNHFEEKAAFAIAPDLYAAATPAVPAAAAIAATDILDLTDRMAADGTLTWSPPPGRWMVLRFGYSLTGAKNGPASPEATGLEVDKLNRSAVSGYLDQYLDQYESASKGLMGQRGVRFVITDSWEAGAQNWSKDLFTDFKQRRGYDMHPWMPVLVGRVVKSAEASDRFLWDFRQTLGELVVENHYTQLAESLKRRDMGLYSESHESGRAFIGDGMSVKRRATVPMGAMWTQVPGVNTEQYGYDADIRESASVAHIYGQNLVAAESMTAAAGAWAWAPEYLKPTADQEMAMGLNRFVIHTSVHQPLIDKAPGLALGPFGQWFTRNETWAEQAAPWIRYLARSSFLLQQGRFVADVAYYYGEDSNVTALFAAKAPNVPQGYNYDFINADTLVTALSVKDGAIITPSGMQYRVLALDSNALHMSLPVLRRLTELVAAGAVVVGDRPTDTPSLADDPEEFSRQVLALWGVSGGKHAYGKGAVYSGQALDAVLLSLGVAPDVQFEPRSGTDLRFVHRALPDGDVYYIDNRQNQREPVDMSFRVDGKAPEFWHADSGGREPASYRRVAGRTLVPLDLDAHETVFVVFRHSALGTQRKVPAPVETPLLTLADSWQLKFPAQRGAPTAQMPATLTSWSDSSDEGVKYFSGTALYTTTMQAPTTWFASGARIWLDLGKVMNVAEVVLNGKNLGVAWKAPFRIDMTPALKPGANQLQVKVTNLWVNRLIGDLQPGAKKKYTFTTQAFYRADAPLLPSGLLGPVRVIRISRLEH
jgi:alpha-L-rhamnosidase/F5/8 type C domain